MINKKIKTLTVLILAINLVAQAQHTVTGVISDRNGSPVQGVTIAARGTALTAVSAANGRYTIEVPGNETILVYSFGGNIVAEIFVSTQREIDVRIDTNVRQARQRQASNMQPSRIDPIYYETSPQSARSNNANNQTQGKIRAGLDGGFIRQFGENMPNGNRTRGQRGQFNAINLGYNIEHNMNVGVKIGIVQIYTRTDNMSRRSANMNFAGTYTYYFGAWAFPFIPYIGGGLGAAQPSSFHWEARESNNTGGLFAPSSSFDSEYREAKISGFVTTGVEFGKFRVTAEYNIIPASQNTISYYDSNGTHIETNYLKSRNSFLAVTVGFFVGGGKRVEN